MKFLVRPCKFIFFASGCDDDCYRHIKGCYPRLWDPKRKCSLHI